MRPTQPSINNSYTDSGKISLSNVSLQVLVNESLILHYDAKGAANSNSSVVRRLPQALIIGVPKAGTRALLTFLDLHPLIKSAGPEPHFFDENSNYVRGFEWYRALMPPSRSDQITIEKTPGYFISEKYPSEFMQ